ncbi:Pentatricopeptide repeat-containing protein [Apostasia shenzhenica]|uniref:Pentatricopeptide repeat-containing protein n=1 Tax=Apostasia shenzhenica TaxID=1088818 RepID=A0A2H9ZYX9_9ASPA|nr:Pentatricopeptide repeat-containing protein [Apostasia shenzhenica]
MGGSFPFIVSYALDYSVLHYENVSCACHRMLRDPAPAGKALSAITYAFSELSECSSLPHLKQIHALLTTSGISGNGTAITKILRSAALSLPGDIIYASFLFRRIRKSDTSLWNVMLQGYSLRSHHHVVVFRFCQMLREGAIPNEHTYPVLLKSISNSAAGDPNQIHSLIFKFGLIGDSFIQNSLLSCYAKGGNLHSARKLFDEMPHRDAIACSALVQGHVKGHLPEEGLKLFIEMRELGTEVDEVTIVSLLNGCAMVKNVWLGRCIHSFYIECGRVKRDVYVDSALVDLYAKCGRSDDAKEVFDEMPSRNVVSWSSLISGFVRCNRFKEALSIFCEMLVHGPKPNQVTLTGILAACAHLGALEQGRWVHSYMYRNDIEVNNFTVGTALIDMYAKCGCVDDAFSMFNGLPSKDVYCWTALINGLAVNGRSFECLHLFSRMIQEGLRPNEITFLSVLTACCHGGLLEESEEYFDCMEREYGIKPKLEHYGCMVNLFGRAGNFEKALLYMKNMPMEPSSAMWGALFRACMIHQNFVLGERVGKHLVGMKPEQSGGYVLLTNLYSLSCRWVEAAGVRTLMRGRMVEKAAGCSWVEVNGVLHGFLSSDGSHAQAEILYQTADRLTLVMKLEGDTVFY